MVLTNGRKSIIAFRSSVIKFQLRWGLSFGKIIQILLLDRNASSPAGMYGAKNQIRTGRTANRAVVAGSMFSGGFVAGLLAMLSMQAHAEEVFSLAAPGAVASRVESAIPADARARLFTQVATGSELGVTH